MSRMIPGMNAQERELPPGRMATRIKVSPSPRNKIPPFSKPVKLSNTEITPSVNITPPGMIAHQRFVSEKYTHQNARLIAPRNTDPLKAPENGDAANPRSVNAGKIAHH